jgi:hypothetical protein
LRVILKSFKAFQIYYLLINKRFIPFYTFSSVSNERMNTRKRQLKQTMKHIETEEKVKNGMKR